MRCFSHTSPPLLLLSYFKNVSLKQSVKIQDALFSALSRGNPSDSWGGEAGVLVLFFYIQTR